MNYDDVKIKINGVDLPVAPTTYDLESSDLDSTGVRSITNGVLKRNRIRKDMLKISLEWQNITIAQANILMNMVDDETFNVELYDVLLCARVTKKMYAGNKQHSYKVIGDDVIDAKVSFNLVEV